LTDTFDMTQIIGTHIFIYIQIHLYKDIYVYIHIYIYMYIYVHIFLCICIYVYRYIRYVLTNTSVLIYSFIYLYTYQYFYLCSAEGIFLTNSFDMTHNPQGLSCGMYCALARYEHEYVFFCFDLDVHTFMYKIHKYLEYISQYA
jgi:hypothetical protein